jgi:hypothetical protein
MELLRAADRLRAGRMGWNRLVLQMKSLLDPDFRYVPAATHSDLDKFRSRMRRYARDIAADKARSERGNVQPITKRRNNGA